MTLDVLPVRTGSAAENMALDFLLLQRRPDATRPVFRHYRWRSPAFTFGYSQKISFVRSRLPDGGPWDLCRRPTGGGIVDHRDDWTFTLVIPRGHPLEDARASQSYRAVHDCLAESLKAQGVAAVLKSAAATGFPTVAPTGGGPAGVCFESAEPADVVQSGTDVKIAGAAQKRNKRGLLFQGTVWRPSVGAIDWEVFHDDFAARLGALLGGDAVRTPWPELSDEEAEGLAERYASPEWMEAR
jgi:lipoyl(octanoyl) transferase